MLILIGLIIGMGSLTIAVHGALSPPTARLEDKAGAAIAGAIFNHDGRIDLPADIVGGYMSVRDISPMPSASWTDCRCVSLK